MKKEFVISLYDFTGEAVKPWAKAGYKCICFDIQHSKIAPDVVYFDGGGSIYYMNADLHNIDNLSDIAKAYQNKTAFMMAFPECTDLAVSGAAHFEKKKMEDPLFSQKAAEYAVWCGRLGDALGCAYYVENPVSTLSTHWRKPDYTFHPYEYGGYIPGPTGSHPLWPEYIAPFDAYPKKTCLWAGPAFIMPEKKIVECPKGYSAQHKKLGGKSLKTKNIRSATPRGFANAVMIANSDLNNS